MAQFISRRVCCGVGAAGFGEHESALDHGLYMLREASGGHACCAALRDSLRQIIFQRAGIAGDAGVAGGALFRLGVGASSFLVPLMLQIGFGLDALTSGLITFTSALGALTMKFFAPRILALASFRRVLIFNGLMASAFIGAVALVGPATPHAAISGLLFVTGLLRSLQFTSLHAITYADVSEAQASAATSIASVGQQVSLSFGVALGALALEASQYVNAHTAPMAGDFSVALLSIAALSSLCVWRMARLPYDAGYALSGKSKAIVSEDEEA